MPRRKDDYDTMVYKMIRGSDVIIEVVDAGRRVQRGRVGKYFLRAVDFGRSSTRRVT